MLVAGGSVPTFDRGDIMNRVRGRCSRGRMQRRTREAECDQRDQPAADHEADEAGHDTVQ